MGHHTEENRHFNAFANEISGMMPDGDPSKTRVVTKCSDGSYCCGIRKKAEACCSSGDGLWIENGTMTNRSMDPPHVRHNSRGESTSNFATLSNDSGFKASSTSLSVPTLSTFNNPTSPDRSSPPGHNYARIIAGSTVGGAGAAVLTIGIIKIMKHLISQRRNRTTPSPHIDPLPNLSPIAEADGIERPTEKDGRLIHEKGGA